MGEGIQFQAVSSNRVELKKTTTPGDIRQNRRARQMAYRTQTEAAEKAISDNTKYTVGHAAAGLVMAPLYPIAAAHAAYVYFDTRGQKAASDSASLEARGLAQLLMSAKGDFGSVVQSLSKCPEKWTAHREAVRTILLEGGYTSQSIQEVFHSVEYQLGVRLDAPVPELSVGSAPLTHFTKEQFAFPDPRPGGVILNTEGSIITIQGRSFDPGAAFLLDPQKIQGKKRIVIRVLEASAGQNGKGTPRAHFIHCPPGYEGWRDEEIIGAIFLQAGKTYSVSLSQFHGDLNKLVLIGIDRQAPSHLVPIDIRVQIWVE